MDTCLITGFRLCFLIDLNCSFCCWLWENICSKAVSPNTKHLHGPRIITHWSVASHPNTQSARLCPWTLSAGCLIAFGQGFLGDDPGALHLRAAETFNVLFFLDFNPCFFWWWPRQFFGIFSPILHHKGRADKLRTVAFSGTTVNSTPKESWCRAQVVRGDLQEWSFTGLSHQCLCFLLVLFTFNEQLQKA